MKTHNNFMKSLKIPQGNQNPLSWWF